MRGRRGDLRGDSSEKGEEFFSASGELAEAVKLIAALLFEGEVSRKATEIAVSALAEAGVIQPWSIVVKAAEGERTVTGLFQIDEAALNGLSNEDYLNLRCTSALPLAHMQLLLMVQVGVFDQISKLHAQLAPKPAAAAPQTSGQGGFRLRLIPEAPADQNVVRGGAKRART